MFFASITVNALTNEISELESISINNFPANNGSRPFSLK